MWKCQRNFNDIFIVNFSVMIFFIFRFNSYSLLLHLECSSMAENVHRFFSFFAAPNLFDEKYVWPIFVCIVNSLNGSVVTGFFMWFILSSQHSFYYVKFQLTGNAAHIFISLSISSLHSNVSMKLTSGMNNGRGGGGIVNFGGWPGPSQASIPHSKSSSIIFHIQKLNSIFVFVLWIYRPLCGLFKNRNLIFFFLSIFKNFDFFLIFKLIRIATLAFLSGKFVRTENREEKQIKNALVYCHRMPQLVNQIDKKKPLGKCFVRK